MLTSTMLVSWPCNTTNQNFAGNKIKAHLMGTWEQSNNTVGLWQLWQQILAMQKAYDNVASPANIAITIQIHSRVSICLTC
jgi:hypothetical protein